MEKERNDRTIIERNDGPQPEIPHPMDPEQQKKNELGEAIPRPDEVRPSKEPPRDSPGDPKGTARSIKWRK
ncbi:hypothetical protein ABB02_00029 [Clostridiaceae bacterium JG1575]|nr:hypothetical protein ABB02_00029 [Clostridiaceae bacterium JG1575]